MAQSQESRASLAGVLAASAARKLASSSSYEKRVTEIPSGFRSVGVLPSLSARLRAAGGVVPAADKRQFATRLPFKGKPWSTRGRT